MSNINGQQKTQQNLAAFRSWVATQPDSDIKQIIFRGQLGRGKIAKVIGCGKSALTQNLALKQEQANLKTELRNKGVLPELSKTAKEGATKPNEYDNTVTAQRYRLLIPPLVRSATPRSLLPLWVHLITPMPRQPTAKACRFG